MGLDSNRGRIPEDGSASSCAISWQDNAVVKPLATYFPSDRCRPLLKLGLLDAENGEAVRVCRVLYYRAPGWIIQAPDVSTHDFA